MPRWTGLVFSIFGLLSCNAYSAAITVKMYSVSPGQKGHYLGAILAKDVRRGLLLMPALHNLPPGYHGFHLHSRPSCLNAGKAAGSHWDPKQTAHHRGPYRSGGHRGDLPVLYVDSSGSAQRAVLAPRLTVSDLIGHAFVIHRDGDNYTDRPKNGGGGGRMACGVVLKRSFRS